MDQDQLRELHLLITNVQDRLTKLEMRLGFAEIPNPVKETVELPTLPRKVRERNPAKPGNILGIVGVSCLILAMILLIKFSIDSGWLTPIRQMFLAALFGSGLIALPFVLKTSEKEYLSLLPAAGVVVLHLTNYGAIFYHHLLSPMIGIWAVWAVGSLSLWLLLVFKSEIYALLAIAGTYIGIFVLSKEFGDFGVVGIHLILWDLIFVSFGVLARNRSIISIAAYFALGIVAFYGLISAPLTPELALQLSIIQLCQIMLTALASTAYSLKHNEGLKESEAIQLLPVFLFFYGLEYSYLNIINHDAAPIFSLIFGAIILGLYWLAKNRLQKDQLPSSSAIYSFLAIIFAHAVYMVLLGALGKLIMGLALMIMAGQLKDQLRTPAWKGASIVGFFMIGWSLLMILNKTDHLPDWQYLVFGIVYGAFLLIGHHSSRVSILLPIAHFMIVTSLCRLNEFIPEMWIGPLCVAYAFGCLTLAWKKEDLDFAKAAFPIIFFAIGRFLFYTFPGFSQGERIISLLAMGALIYAGGFVYRKVNLPKSLKTVS